MINYNLSDEMFTSLTAHYDKKSLYIYRDLFPKIERNFYYHVDNYLDNPERTIDSLRRMYRMLQRKIGAIRSYVDSDKILNFYLSMSNDVHHFAKIVLGYINSRESEIKLNCLHAFSAILVCLATTKKRRGRPRKLAS